MMALRAPLATVVVIRHGSTQRNRGGVGLDQVRGHADIPMTAEGRFEVGVTAGILANIKLERIYSSDLQRATETADIVADAQREPYPEIIHAKQLRSWDMGPSIEGQVTTPEVIAQIKNWVANDTVVPPGGESFRAFCGRLLGFVGPVFEQAEKDRTTVGFVCHGRSTQVIDFWVAAGCDEACMHRDFAEQLAEEPDNVPPGGAIRFKYDGKGWLGIVVPTGAASIGTRVMGGDYASPREDGVIVS